MNGLVKLEGVLLHRANKQRTGKHFFLKAFMDVSVKPLTTKLNETENSVTTHDKKK